MENMQKNKSLIIRDLIRLRDYTEQMEYDMLKIQIEKIILKVNKL